MTINLSWNIVEDKNDMRPEFGSCHVNYAWRRHKQNSHKFESLENAFGPGSNSVLKLLQNLGGNTNAANYAGRGNCLYVALWYPDEHWALLCDPISVTLVAREAVESISVTKNRDDQITESLKTLFASSEPSLQRELNASFYATVIA